MYSKVFEEVVGETKSEADGFVAIMTCSDADEACPFVPGAALRVSLPYDDPKASDGSAEEAATYDTRSREIAGEMAYLFHRVAEAELRFGA
jgi:hypothetical protein